MCYVWSSKYSLYHLVVKFSFLSPEHCNNVTNILQSQVLIKIK